MENLSMVKGKVVLVLFPFDDLTSAKLRPAVCLTDPIGSHRHVVLAFITSQIPEDVWKPMWRLILAGMPLAPQDYECPQRFDYIA